MATNNRPLKSYVRYDGSGRAVSSSLIWRKNKPKVGNWKEVQGYECCDTFECASGTTNLLIEELTFNESSPAAVGLRIICENSPFNQITTLYTVFYSGPAPSTPEIVIDILNDNFSSLGTFTLLTPTSASLQINNSYLPFGVCSNPQLQIEYYF
jgi:hypothetical protein